MHTSAPLESYLKTKKSASGKHHPDEAHSPGEETSRHFCTAPTSKIQLKVVKHFRTFADLFSNCHLFFAIVVQNSPILIMFSGTSAIFTEKNEISSILDVPEISQKELLNFSENVFLKRYKKVR